MSQKKGDGGGTDSGNNMYNTLETNVNVQRRIRGEDMERLIRSLRCCLSGSETWSW